MKNFPLIILTGLLFTACKGESDNPENNNSINIEENQSDSTNQTVEIDPTKVMEDTIDGQPNNMVFQREDGLRIEWTVKKEDNPIELNDVVMVNYNARVAAGEEFDSNEEIGEPIPLKTNIGMMIEGWEEGLLYMHEGDKGRIMIPSAMAYGETGYKTIVPPDADIIIDIEIVEIIEPLTLEDGVKVYKWKTNPQGTKGTKNQTVTFDYFAYKMGKNAGMYDNSYKNQTPFSFKLKNDNVVDGLHIGMAEMKEGENAFIEIPAKVAYGSKGLVDLVPANTNIVYDVRVNSIE